MKNPTDKVGVELIYEVIRERFFREYKVIVEDEYYHKILNELKDGKIHTLIDKYGDEGIPLLLIDGDIWEPHLKTNDFWIVESVECVGFKLDECKKCKIITTPNPNNVRDKESSKINEEKMDFWGISWSLLPNIEFISIT